MKLDLTIWGTLVLERNELEAFLAVAEELHFGRAAARLRVSTARVSQTIRKLERQVGVALFDRTSRRVELSRVGRALYEDLRPAHDQIAAALERAVVAGRGVTGILRVCFTGAAGGRLLVRASQAFRQDHPECDVQIREAQIGELMPWLRGGDVDLALATFPVDEPGVAAGPVLVSEARFLAVPVDHPLARRDAVSVEDLATVTVLQLPDTLPRSLLADRTPHTTPAGLPIKAGQSASTFQEILALVGDGQGVFPVGANASRYYPRPDVAYVHLRDAPPLHWGLLWRTDDATARVRAFAEAVHVVAHPFNQPQGGLDFGSGWAT
ncbi:LysR substrate-binding domain-containing protein [Micromonospora sp. WMMD1120]|uniref:LysR family transcriptional regulator n=1 Tax=Micromonospora sp. WMMD1120 TaxID=3016106 RepID=UPI002417F54F|nr:LysR substrate-binding domain-containing protein [Micromonospora sp. WMMD1120]MDG4811008.1 LysR substrate-binding domain-containing protein [Micromonospora sp. WMMD1120]